MTKSLLASLLFLAACAEDPQPVPGGDVVGSWRELPDSNDDPTDVADRAVIEFADDGTFTRTDGSQPANVGTYELLDGRLVVTMEGGPSSEFSYYADGIQLMFGIGEPDDDGADAVATWTSHILQAGAPVETILSLAADGTAHFEQTTDDGTTTMDGAWVQVDDDIEASYEIDENTTVSMGGSLYAGFLGSAYESI